MDATQLKAAVTLLGGPEKVFMLGYDNASRIFFTKERPFSLDMISGEFIKTEGLSMERLPVVELKPIECIQTIIGVTDSEHKDKIDMHYFRS